MRIAVIGAPWVPVPPPAYGGTEAVLADLLPALAATGHEVAYAGHPDSTVGVEVLAAIEAAVDSQMGNTAAELAHVLAAYEDAARWGADLIHDHTLVGPLSGPAEVPVVVTSHGPFDALTTPIFERIARRANVMAISRSQARSAPSVPITAVVHHGLEARRWPLGAGGRHLTFLGRMHPHKAPDRAIRIARRAGVPLVLAAKMREPAEIAYFEECVRPLLHADACFVGEADAVAKRELLAGSIALLNPIAWPEPLGMVMLEALACGTPVLASPLGAAPEIVDHGRNGYLCTSDDDFVAAVDAAGRLDRRACRATVVERFPVERMVDGYLEVFGAAVSRRTRTVA